MDPTRRNDLASTDPNSLLFRYPMHPTLLTFFFQKQSLWMVAKSTSCYRCRWAVPRESEKKRLTSICIDFKCFIVTISLSSPMKNTVFHSYHHVAGPSYHLAIESNPMRNNSVSSCLIVTTWCFPKIGVPHLFFMGFSVVNHPILGNYHHFRKPPYAYGLWSSIPQ